MATSKIEELKNINYKFGMFEDKESNLIPPFTALLSTPLFKTFLGALLQVMAGDIFLLAYTGGREVEEAKLMAYTEWELEQVMKDCITEITSKYQLKLDENGKFQGIKIKRTEKES